MLLNVRSGRDRVMDWSHLIEEERRDPWPCYERLRKTDIEGGSESFEMATLQDVSLYAA